MPRLDGTGPTGRGPMTGRGLGRCTGNAYRAPYMRGGDFGPMFRRFWVSPKNNIDELEMEASALKQELSMVEEEIKEIKKQNKNE